MSVELLNQKKKNLLQLDDASENRITMIKPIKTKKQYKQYLSRAYELMQLKLKPNSEESDELEVLSILIEK